MQPNDLYAWLVARWQEKLDTARVATPGPWQADDDGAVFVDSSDPDMGERRDHITDVNVIGSDDLDHVIAFDPAFAIAVCEAALRRLARHRPASEVGEFVGLCFAHWDYTVWTDCPEVLDDAAPFADRDDCPEELKHP
jgi:hypothetical protein